MSEPLPVIPLQYAPPSESAAEADHRLRWVVVAAWLACAIAWVLIIAVDVESVIISGPVIFLIGGWILYRAIRLRSPAHAVLGATHCAICMLFVMLVQLRNWSPDEAKTPFTLMGGVYTLISGVVSVWLIIRALPRR